MKHGGFLREIDLRRLRADGSVYALRPRPPAPDELCRSMEEIGQQVPLLAHERAPGEPHVMDGFRRAAAAARLGWRAVHASVLPADAAPERVLRLLATSRRELLAESAVARVRLVRLAFDAGLPAGRVRDAILPAAGLEAHETVLRRCRAAAELDTSVLDFCDEKRLSLRLCAHLARLPREAVDLVFSWKDRVGLTASTFVEMIEAVSDCARRERGAVKDVAGRPDVAAALGSRGPAKQRTEALLSVVRALRSPVLTEANERIEAIVDELGLPREVRVDWDRTLERREVGVRLAVRDPEDLQAGLSALGRPEVREAVRRLLDRL